MGDAEKRVALVIGNANYGMGRSLANPVNDAKAIGGALERLGFQVHQQNDLGFFDMGRAFSRFAVEARSASIALIYFAGHGMEVDGQNYLLPVDAVLDDVSALPHETKKLSDITDAVNNARRLGLIVLDACRDNPYRLRMRRNQSVPLFPTGSLIVRWNLRTGRRLAPARDLLISAIFCRSFRKASSLDWHALN